MAFCVLITCFKVGKLNKFSRPLKTEVAISAMSKLTFQFIRLLVLGLVEFGTGTSNDWPNGMERSMNGCRLDVTCEPAGGSS